MNNTMLWVIVAAAAILTLGAVLYFMSAGPTATKPTPPNVATKAGEQPEDRLPETLDGFVPSMPAAKHVEPASADSGENHSAFASFRPAPGSLYENVIESLGISIFLYDDVSKMPEAKALLTQGLKLEPTMVENQEVGLALDAQAGEVHLTWEEGPLLFYVAATLTKDAKEKNMDLLKKAAVMAATFILKMRKQ